MSSYPCLGCGKVWTGARRCHCATCHENFSSISTFDRHRVNGYCRNPIARGLIRVNGYWQQPAMPQEALTARLGGSKRPSTLSEPNTPKEA